MKRLILLALLPVLAAAAPVGPGEVAISYLEKIRAHDVDLAPGKDTALSEQTSETKREKIRERLERLGDDLQNSRLLLVSEKKEGDFAAGLAVAINTYDPQNIQAHAVALLLRDGKWVPAPLPASFENTGANYLLSARDTLESLTQWMLGGQSSDLEAMRQKAQADARAELARALSPSELRSLTPEMLLRRFAEAGAKRESGVLLALLGGLSEPLPEDWSERVFAVQRLVDAPKDPLPPFWAQLCDPRMIRAVVRDQSSKKKTSLDVAWLDPAVESGADGCLVGSMRFHFTRSKDGLWRTEPPPFFFDEDADGGELDDPLRSLSNRIAMDHPPTPEPSPEALADALAKAIAQPAPAAWMALFKAPADEDNLHTSLSLAASLWWSQQGARIPPCIELVDRRQEGDEACCILLVYYAASMKPGKLIPCRMVRTAEGWLWQPRRLDVETSPLDKWVTERMSVLESEWPSRFLAHAATLCAWPQSVPGEQETRAAVRKYLDALATGDLRKALATTAWLNEQKDGSVDGAVANELLRDLSFEIASIVESDAKPTVKAVFIGKSIAAAGVAHAGGPDAPPWPIHPVVDTPDGPRVLIGWDLRVGKGRTRDFLNQTVVKKLAMAHPAQAADLAEMVADFGKMHQTDMETGK